MRTWLTGYRYRLLYVPLQALRCVSLPFYSPPAPRPTYLRKCAVTSLRDRFFVRHHVGAQLHRVASRPLFPLPPVLRLDNDAAAAASSSPPDVYRVLPSSNHRVVQIIAPRSSCATAARL